MSRPIVEVIALDAVDARAAREGGADRLELTAEMGRDGLTPDRATFAAVRDAVDIPVRVMLRARDGFAAGGEREVAELCAAAEGLRAEGAREFVMGFLDADGGPDLAVLRVLTEAIDGCAWTFHRAVDRAADRAALRAGVAGLPGLDTFLTAGSPLGVAAGLPVLLAEAAEPAPDAPRLMAGGGLRAEHLPALRNAGVTAFHVGGAVRFDGWSTPVDPAAVRAWRTALDTAVAVVD
jgi:copper homeostasis protein